MLAATIALAAVVLPMPISPIADQVEAGGHLAFGHRDASLNRLERLRAAHRRAVCGIRRTWRNLEGQEPGVRRQLGRDPEVGHRDTRPGAARQRVDRRATGQEVRDHLRCHRGRVSADALRPLLHGHRP